MAGSGAAHSGAEAISFSDVEAASVRSGCAVGDGSAVLLVCSDSSILGADAAGKVSAEAHGGSANEKVPMAIAA